MKKNTVNILIKAVVAGIALCVIAIFAVKADAQRGVDGMKKEYPARLVPRLLWNGDNGQVRTLALRGFRYTVNYR
jgi:hypothetical protein